MPHNVVSHLGLHCLLVSYLETLGITGLNTHMSRVARGLVDILLHHLFPYLVCETGKALTRLHACTGLPKPSLVTHLMDTVFIYMSWLICISAAKEEKVP